VNGKHFLNEALSLGMYHEKTSVMGYRILSEASGIHLSNPGLQITHDIYINSYLMKIFDLTTYRSASEGHTSHPENGNIRIDLKFNRPLPETMTCLPDLLWENSFLVDFSRNFTTIFKSEMDTVQIRFTLRDVSSFPDVFPSDLLPHSIVRTNTLIINADPNTERGSHWLAVHFRHKSSSVYRFESYGIVPLVPSIQAFFKRNCTTWDNNKRQL